MFKRCDSVLECTASPDRRVTRSAQLFSMPIFGGKLSREWGVLVAWQPRSFLPTSPSNHPFNLPTSIRLHQPLPPTIVRNLAIRKTMATTAAEGSPESNSIEQSASRLLSLPTELRYMIWKYAVPQITPAGQLSRFVHVVLSEIRNP